MHFTLKPVLHGSPDPRKLGRAFLALAIHLGNLEVHDSANKREKR